MTSGPLLAAARLTKAYAGVGVLHGVDFDVRAGEVHALMGENGAGKSTLIKILGGAVAPDRGSVTLDGMRLPPGDPHAARRAGIAVVHQELTLVPDLTVADNIALGRERGAFLRPSAGRLAARAALDRVGIVIDPGVLVRGLRVANQQMVEIARALSGEARILILDEPTASLPTADADRLFRVLNALRQTGIGIVYISHRLDEVFALADRITVLRDGHLVASTAAASLTRGDLIRQMVGRDVTEEFPARPVPSGAPLLEVEHLSAPPRLDDVSLDVRAGEIVGLAGLVGAGRTSAGLAIAGALAARGRVMLRGSQAAFTSPHAALRGGVAYVTEDRKTRGLVREMSVTGNLTLASLHRLARSGWLSPAREREAAADAARRFNVRGSSLDDVVVHLSGGNQQKVLLARATMAGPALLVLDEPTRGVDVGARAEIYHLMNVLTAAGLGILMISSDLPEVLGMSDRVFVMREGRTAGALGRADATAERIMALATAA